MLSLCSPNSRGKARVLASALSIALAAVLSFAGEIQLNNNQIPRPPGALKRLKNSKATPPTAFVQKVLAGAHPNAKLESLGQSEFARKHNIRATKDIQAAIVNDRVVASIDTAKGHADVLADLENLPLLAPGGGPGKNTPVPQGVADKAKTAAADVLRQGVFPRDATRASLEKMITLETSQFVKGPNGPPAVNPAKSGPIMVTFPVKRTVGELPVFGPGSRGHVDVGADGKLHGFSVHWQNARDNDTVTETRSQGEIADLIRQELAETATKGDVVVESVELGYYDGDEGFIQPVYQYRAKLTYKPTTGGVNEDYIAGYIPIGTVLEPIPSVNAKGVGGPAVPQGAPSNLPVSEWMPTEPPAQMAAMEIPPDDPTIGRYVVRNDYAGWVNSANGFWNGLQASGYGSYFTNAQYYWAYPFETGSSKNSYVNAVHVALLEVHGDWWIWSTYQDWGDIGTVDAIPSPGLGPSAGGVAANLIIHSCEVVPAAADTASWPDKWWHVFGGLHSVFGYRTIMYIDDGAMYPFGIHMGRGYGLVNAWLSDVASSSMYWGSPGKVMHGVWKPYGRPSTISVCGHEGDSVYYTAGVGPAGCLQNYWYW